MLVVIKRFFLMVLIYVLLGVNRVIIIMVPFRKIAARMGETMVIPEYGNDPNKYRRAKTIGFMIETLSKNTFWQSKCFVKALTAKELLKLFRIPATIYFGMAKDQENSLQAHAWVEHGDAIITGAKERADFNTVAYFGS